MAKTFLWCSVHQPTPEQTNDLTSKGQLLFLSDVAPELQSQLANTPTLRKEMGELAENVLNVALEKEATIVQLGGSPAFIFVAGGVINTVLSRDRVMFADSERVSEDIPQADGSVKKISVFKHRGWI